MREYSHDYAPKTVTAIDVSTDPVTPVRGTVYFGIRVQDESACAFNVCTGIQQKS